MRIRYSFSSRRTGHIENIAKQRTKFPDAAKKIINISDIILEVFDARFVNEMRNRELEDAIRKAGKKIIFVLNKADLVDAREINFPKDLRPFVFISAKTGAGSKNLREKIKIEAKKIMHQREKNPRPLKSISKNLTLKENSEESEKYSKVHVGIIGYPNTGKSSIINLITRRASASVSKKAGHTKGIQKIKLADGILMLDSPGVIPSEKYSTIEGTSNEDAMLGAKTYSDVKNPDDAVYLIAEKNLGALEKFYGIKCDSDIEELINEVGKKKNFILKKGKIDVDRAARLILRDWQEGKIK